MHKAAGRIASAALRNDCRRKLLLLLLLLPGPLLRQLLLVGLSSICRHCTGQRAILDTRRLHKGDSPRVAISTSDICHVLEALVVRLCRGHLCVAKEGV
jgi:hypothetical protein